MRLSRFLPLAVVVAAACDGSDAARSLPLAPALDVRGATAVGQLYTSTNSPAGNEVLLFNRASDGALTAAGNYATGGAGTGAGLGSQGALALSSNGRFLVVVNAGSNEVSSFVVQKDGTPKRRSTVSSGGIQPISVTISGSLVYVVNAGGSGNIAGFTLVDGALQPIAGSSRPLSSSAAGAAQIQFSPNGRWLIVTEKNTNSIDVYTVAPTGLTSGPAIVPSSGATPFGFAIRGGILVVSEAFGGAVNGSATSSYELHANGTLTPISASVPTTETAACWIAITGDGRFAYAANAGSQSLTGYAINQGRLTLLNADGVTGSVGPGHNPIDIMRSNDSQFLYALTAGVAGISAFQVANDGSLTPISGGVSGLPAGTAGLVSR